MILDLILIAILIITAIYGFKKGFVVTLIHTTGWIVAIIASFFATPHVVPLVKAHTQFDEWLMEGLSFRFDTSTGVKATEQSLPSGLGTLIDQFTHSASTALAKSFTNVVLSILVFVVIFLIIKLILWLILRGLSRRYHGHINGADAFFGILIGLVKGMIFVYLFLALLMPAINLMAPDFTEGVTSSLNHSYLAKTFYDHNLMLMLLQGLFK